MSLLLLHSTPSLLTSFNFMSDGVLPTGISFSRSSAAWSFNNAGQLTQASANLPRWDYDPATLALRGLLLETTATNNALWSSDLTNVAWVKTSCAAAQNQVGLNGATNNATLLTATAANATVLQSLTAAASNRTLSVWMRRVTGSGSIEITQDNGTTWTAVVPASSWTLVQAPVASVLNPVFGIRLGTSGDQIAVGHVQLENLTAATSPIPTTSGAVTRTIDVCTYTNIASLIVQDAFSFYLRYLPQSVVNTTAATLAQFIQDTNNRYGFDKPASIQTRQFSSLAGTLTSVNGGNAVGLTLQRFAGRFNSNNNVWSRNGAAAVAMAAVVNPTTVADLHFGHNSGASAANIWLQEARIIRTVLDNATLQGWATT